MRNSILSIFLFFSPVWLQAQGYFTSKSDGDWNNSSTWTLVSGTTLNNIPGSADSVIILSGHKISIDTTQRCQSLSIRQSSQLILDSLISNLTVVNNLSLSDGSQINILKGALTVTGNVSIALSSINQTGGIVNILGIINANNSLAISGSTKINIQSGVFNCVGGVNLITSVRSTELEIGAGFVTIAGLLTALGNAAKIRFTGNGTLTLAGIITLTNNNFVAGTGRVVYVGIPGTDQGIASLNYYRLVITGVGGGIKTISGNVNVADSLVLVSDTLKINSGSLTMASNSTIVRSAGKILSPPSFAGTVDLVYNNALRDTTGPEMPLNVNTLSNLYINNPGGVQLSQNCYVNNKLVLSTGEFSTHNNILFIRNSNAGISDDPAVEQINGYVSGTIERSINISTGIRYFPFGQTSIQSKRGFTLFYTTAPSSSGSLKVSYENRPIENSNGLPINSGLLVLDKTFPFFWRVNALNGLSGGIYSLQLSPQNVAGLNDLNTARIIKQSGSINPWYLDGVSGGNSGTNLSPIVKMDNMSGFSDFTIAYKESSITAVTDLRNMNVINLYPNPIIIGNQLLKITLQQFFAGTEFTFKLFSITGIDAGVYNFKMNSGTTTVSIPLPTSLPRGLYYFVLSSHSKKYGSGSLLVQ